MDDYDDDEPDLYHTCTSGRYCMGDCAVTNMYDNPDLYLVHDSASDVGYEFTETDLGDLCAEVPAMHTDDFMSPAALARVTTEDLMMPMSSEDSYFASAPMPPRAPRQRRTTRVRNAYNTVLSEMGAVVVPVYRREKVDELRAELEGIVWPELGQTIVERGGKLETLSSYHHRFVQQLRYEVKRELMERGVFADPSFFECTPDSGADAALDCYYLTEMYNTLEYIPEAARAERWFTPMCIVHGRCVKDPMFFGGWLNLSSQPREFVFLPGSYLPKIYHLTEDIKREHFTYCKNRAVTVMVPPGHTVIYHHGLTVGDSMKVVRAGPILNLAFHIQKTPNELERFEPMVAMANLTFPRTVNGNKPAVGTLIKPETKKGTRQVELKSAIRYEDYINDKLWQNAMFPEFLDV